MILRVLLGIKCQQLFQNLCLLPLHLFQMLTTFKKFFAFLLKVTKLRGGVVVRNVVKFYSIIFDAYLWQISQHNTQADFICKLLAFDTRYLNTHEYFQFFFVTLSYHHNHFFHYIFYVFSHRFSFLIFLKEKNKKKLSEIFL